METADSRLLSYEDLCAITGLVRYGDITRCLRRQGIAVFYGKGGVPWTTVDLINAAGGLRPAQLEDDKPYGPEICL